MPSVSGGPPEQGGVSQGLGRRQQHQQPRLARQPRHAGQEFSLQQHPTAVVLRRSAQPASSSL